MTVLFAAPFFAGLVGGVIFGYLQGSRGVPGIYGILGAIALAVVADVYSNLTVPDSPVFVPMWTTTFLFFGALPFLAAQWLGYRMAMGDKRRQPNG